VKTLNDNKIKYVIRSLTTIDAVKEITEKNINDKTYTDTDPLYKGT